MTAYATYLALVVTTLPPGIAAALIFFGVTLAAIAVPGR